MSFIEIASHSNGAPLRSGFLASAFCTLASPVVIALLLCFALKEHFHMLSQALNVGIAIVLSLLPVPAMKLLDHLNRGCGDGLCGFFSGLLILGGLGVTTLVFVARSARLNETPAFLRLIPFALWVLALVPMVL